MKKGLVVCLMLNFTLFACSQKTTKEVQILKDFVESIKDKDTLKMKSLIVLESGLNENSLDFNIRQVAIFINKYGIPMDSAYHITEYPDTDDRLLDVNVKIGKSDVFYELTATFHRFFEPNKIFLLFFNYVDTKGNGIIQKPTLKRPD